METFHVKPFIMLSERGHMEKTENIQPKYQNRTICIYFVMENYPTIIEDAFQFRLYIDEMIVKFPELFPSNISEGYRMKDSYTSKKLSVTVRRIDVSGVFYTIRPSFVMPYMTAMTEDVKLPLFYRKFDVPFWAITAGFGRDDMYWYRMVASLGRNSIVGTTVKHAENLPEHVIFDEKHSSIRGEKVYVPTTVANECILGVAIADSAGEEDLEEAYGKFKKEAQNIDPTYAPESGNTDGWKATQNALKSLFPKIRLILCFLHLYISIRDRTKMKFKDIFHEVASKLWDCYNAESKSSFSQRVRRFYEWGKKVSLPSVIFKKIEKLRNNVHAYSVAYDLPGCYRVNTMSDRLMRRMNRHLFNTQYFHGFTSSAELNIRGWALIMNFAPSNPITVKKYEGLQSPAERLNQFRYHDCWLQNLLISASMGGLRSPPQNPL